MVTDNYDGAQLKEIARQIDRFLFTMPGMVLEPCGSKEEALRLFQDGVASGISCEVVQENGGEYITIANFPGGMPDITAPMAAVLDALKIRFMEMDAAINPMRVLEVRKVLEKADPSLTAWLEKIHPFKDLKRTIESRSDWAKLYAHLLD